VIFSRIAGQSAQQTMRVFTAPLTTFIMTDETQMPVQEADSATALKMLARQSRRWVNQPWKDIAEVIYL
jgi:hypothetical protein